MAGLLDIDFSWTEPNVYLPLAHSIVMKKEKGLRDVEVVPHTYR